MININDAILIHASGSFLARVNEIRDNEIKLITGYNWIDRVWISKDCLKEYSKKITYVVCPPTKYYIDINDIPIDEIF